MCVLVPTFGNGASNQGIGVQIVRQSVISQHIGIGGISLGQ